MVEDPPKPKLQGSVPPPPPRTSRSPTSVPPPPPPQSVPPGSVPPPPPFKPATQPFHPEMIMHDPGEAAAAEPNPKMTMQGHVAPQLAGDTLPTTPQPFPVSAAAFDAGPPFEGDEFEGAATAASVAAQPVADPIALPQTGAATAFIAAMDGVSSDAMKDTLRGFADFSFTKLITPRIVKALYALFILDAIATLLTLWYGAVMALVHGSIGGGLGGLILAPLVAVAIIGLGRIVCEWLTIGFRSAKNLDAIREALTEPSDN